MPGDPARLEGDGAHDIAAVPAAGPADDALTRASSATGDEETGLSGSGRDDVYNPTPDTGIEDVLDERGVPGTTPTPDPLKHASSYVDEAKLAEVGVTPIDEDATTGSSSGRDLGYDLGDADREESADHAGAEAQRPKRGRALSFLRHSAEELKRVQWPTRKQTGQGTAVVLGFVVLAGGFLGLMDAIWKPIVEAII
ncbi:MAG: preprotein translocase subunit SecE [Actinomycetota bacterium]|nr:preprotein translocase subunit SecE [Actinomycetota bacterium]